MADENIGSRRVNVCGWELELMDGNGEGRAIVQKIDVEGACCADPNRCVVSRAFERVLTAQGRPCKVTVYNATLRIIWLKRDGDRWVPKDGKVWRYALATNTKAMMRHYDAEESWAPGVTVVFHEVQPHERIGQRSPQRGRKRPGIPHARTSQPPTRGFVSPLIPGPTTEEVNIA